MSLPLRERGLKSSVQQLGLKTEWVAPLAGAWIEILHLLASTHPFLVAPLAGAWIEMVYLFYLFKFPAVAPLAGAWIEI